MIWALFAGNMYLFFSESFAGKFQGKLTEFTIPWTKYLDILRKILEFQRFGVQHPRTLTNPVHFGAQNGQNRRPLLVHAAP